MLQSLEYYRRREQQERASAQRAQDEIARGIHAELAVRYAALLQKRERPSRPDGTASRRRVALAE